MPDPRRIARPWIDAYPPGVPPTYRYPAVSLVRFLDDAARDFPQAVATRFARADLTYVELQALVDRVAGGLAALGVASGARIATILPNLPATVAVDFAAWRCGAVLVPIDPRLDPGAAARVLAETDAAVVVATPDHVEPLLRAASATVRTVVVTEPADWGRRSRVRRVLDRLPRRHRAPAGSDTTTVMTFAELVDAAAPRPADPRVGHGAGPAVIAYTAGTTGPPRGAVLTHANLVANAFQARLWVPDVQAGRERLLAAPSFAHAYGLTLGLLTGVLSAATLLLAADDSPEALVGSLADERATLFPATPTQLEAIVAQAGIARVDLRSLRACVSGAAPLPATLAHEFEETTRGARIREGYGLTEASPLTHANPVYGRAPRGRIGLPVTDTVAVVVDPEEPGRVLRPGEVGELAVAGPQVMAGYHDGPEATAATLRDGWLLTGDLAVTDPEGSFAFVGRRHGEHADAARPDAPRWLLADRRGKVGGRAVPDDQEVDP